MLGSCLDQILGMAILPSPQICTFEQFRNSMKSIRYEKVYVSSEILNSNTDIHVYMNNPDIGIRSSSHTPPKLAGQSTGIRRQWQKQCKKPFFHIKYLLY